MHKKTNAGAKNSKVSSAVKSTKVTIKKETINFDNWVTPLDDRVLVQLISTERTTPGGLYIPDTVADVSGNFQGKVVSVGRGHLDKKGKVRPLDVCKGDQVVFSQFSGSKIEFQGNTLIFIRESEVLGIVNK